MESNRHKSGRAVFPGQAAETQEIKMEQKLAKEGAGHYHSESSVELCFHLQQTTASVVRIKTGHQLSPTFPSKILSLWPYRLGNLGAVVPTH